MGLNDIAFSRVFSRPWNAMANLASVLGLILTALAVIGWNAMLIPLAYLCLLSLFLIVRYMRQERWARYAESAILLEDAYELCQQAADGSVFGVENPTYVLEKLTDSLDSFAQAFTMITGAPCRSCIAEVSVDTGTTGGVSAEEALVVRVLLRSGRRDPVVAEAAQPVAGNTDFLRILQTRRPYFHNDLPKAFKARQYENSKWTQEFLASHPYPYKATIAWPISLSTVADSSAQQQPLAFLCIDTKRKGAFVARSDVPLGSCYAHAVYPVVRSLLA